MDKILKRILTMLPLLFAIATMPVTAANVDILIADENPAMLSLAHAAETALKQLEPKPTVSVITLSALTETRPHNGLLILIGEDLLAWGASTKNPYKQVLNFYISSIAYQNTISKKDNTAIFRDQPLNRQLKLANILLPNAHRALVIHDAALYSKYRITDKNYNLAAPFDLNIEHVNSKEDWAKQLSQWIASNDVLIGIDDQSIYNRDTIRSILLTSYRHGKVLIGPTRNFVAAGSLASAYTSPEQYLTQLQQMVREWLSTQTLPPAQFPDLYSIIVNRQVANSLGLKLPSDEILLQRMQENLEIESCRNGC